MFAPVPHTAQARSHPFTAAQTGLLRVSPGPTLLGYNEVSETAGRIRPHEDCRGNPELNPLAD
jgi:hypothetical protein